MEGWWWRHGGKRGGGGDACSADVEQEATMAQGGIRMKETKCGELETAVR